MRGRFITFEGGEGAGKSTQVERLAQRLRERGVAVVTTREPGGSPAAEAIRHVILSGAAQPLGIFAEALLFAAARADHIRHTIEPALAQGRWVLCDRFADSTRVYQGPGLEGPVLRALERVTACRPDLTLILDQETSEGLRRAAARRGETAADRFEAQALDFHERIRAAYRAIAAAEPERCRLIDAAAPADAVAAAIWNTVEAAFDLPAPARPAEVQPA